MTRHRLGLQRPLAEAVIEAHGGSYAATVVDGAPLMLEYVVLAQLPRPAVKQS